MARKGEFGTFFPDRDRGLRVCARLGLSYIRTLVLNDRSVSSHLTLSPLTRFFCCFFLLLRCLASPIAPDPSRLGLRFIVGFFVNWGIRGDGLKLAKFWAGAKAGSGLASRASSIPGSTFHRSKEF